MDMDVEVFWDNTTDAGRRAITTSSICGKCYKIVKSGSRKTEAKLSVVSKYFSLRTIWK